MPFTVVNLRIRPGYNVSSLSDDARAEEQRVEFKNAFQTVVENKLTVALGAWDPVGAAVTPLVMDASNGNVANNDVETTLSDQIAGDKTPGINLVVGALEDECCEWTANGWRKCRTYRLLYDGANWLSSEVVGEYLGLPGVTLDPTSAVTGELRAMQILATVSWRVGSNP